jgi:hypothetical protein
LYEYKPIGSWIGRDLEEATCASKDGLVESATMSLIRIDDDFVLIGVMEVI